MRIDLIPALDESHGRGVGGFRAGTVSALPSQPEATVAAAAATAGVLSPYEQLLRSIYDGVMISDMTGAVVDSNGRLAEFLRMPPVSLCELTIFDVLSGSDASLIRTLDEHLRQQNFALIQASCVRSDSSLFPAEIAVNHLDLSGVRHLCFFIRDVTVRREQEHLLWTEHNAIQNSGSGIAVADRSGRLEYVNPGMAGMWGCAGSDGLIGHDVRHLFVDALAADAMLAAVLSAGAAWAGQLSAKRKDGGEFAVQVSAGCNRLADGETAGVVFSFVDVTDRIRAERATRESERQRVMLESLGAACHHLGQPATVLLANLDMMKDVILSGRGEGDRLRALVQSSCDAAFRLSAVLHRLNSIEEYRTTEYTSITPSSATPASRIIDINPTV